MARPTGVRGVARFGVLGPLIALLALVGPALLAPGIAQAAGAYRYWGYYHWSAGSWSFAQTGPADATPANGAVEGWRFAVTGANGPTRAPRAAGDFAQLCGSTPAPAGQKKVGVVIDFGERAEAPAGQSPPAPLGGCATVAAGASGAQVLATVASLRESKGLVCAIDRYPKTGCGNAVATVPALPSPEPTVTLRLLGAAGGGRATAPAKTPTPAAGPLATAAATPASGTPGATAAATPAGTPRAAVAAGATSGAGLAWRIAVPVAVVLALLAAAVAVARRRSSRAH